MATSDKVAGKLTPAQQRGINLNKALLLMFQKKHEECQEAVVTLKKQFPDSDVPALVLAALLYREKKSEEAVKTLQEYVAQFPGEKSVRVQIVLAQIQLNQGNVEEAIKILNNTPVKHELSILGAICSLHLKNNDIASCISVLDQSTAHWRERLDKGEKFVKEKLVMLLNKSAQFKMSVSKFPEAVSTYEILVKVDPGNAEHVAGLVNALSRYDLAKAETYSKQLPSIDISDINAENLESETVLVLKSKKQKLDLPTDVSKEAILSVAQGSKKKKKRKNKPAKNTDKNKKPDPERWIPKKLRSTYKKKTTTMRGASQGSTLSSVQEKLQHKKGDKAPLLAPKPTGPKGARNKRRRG